MVFRRLWNSFLLLFAKESFISDIEYASLPPIFHLDDYDNCMFYGKEALYCGTVMQLTPRNPANTSELWKTIDKVTKSRRYIPHEVIVHAFCVPKQCPNLELSNYTITNITLESLDLIKKLGECYSNKFADSDIKTEVKLIRCETRDSPYDFNIFDLLFLVFLIIFVTLVLFASIYDIIKNPNFKDEKFMKTTFGKYISSFSASQNWIRLTKIDLDNPDAKALSCIQGVRFFNLAGVITSHSGMFNLAQPISNIQFFESNNVGGKFEQYFGMGGRLTTLQTFFLMSSFLHAYKFFQECEGRKKVSVSYLARSFFNRYFRLTPMLAIVTIFFTTLMPHLSRGPLWDYVIGDGYRTCRQTWWHNILYLNNFLPLEKLCLAHLWSLSVDIQFYAIGLILLWFMWNYEDKIPYIIGTVWLYHVYNTFFSIYGTFPFGQKIDLDSINITNINRTEIEAGIAKLQVVFYLYKSTTSNIAGFISGIVFGYLFYKCRNKQIFTTENHVKKWWILSWGSIIFIIIFPGIFLGFLVDSQYTEIIVSLYMTFNKTIFTFGIGLFIFGMTQGQGHIIRSFCEWQPIYVLGRLNYNAYLVHILIQRFVVGLKRAPNFLSNYIILYDCFSNLAVSYMASAVLSIFFEYPFAELKKHVSNSLRRKNMIESDKKTQ